MKAFAREFIETLILALLVFLGLQISLQNFRVEGSSMTSTLKGGQYVLVNKLVYWKVPSLGNLDKLIPFAKKTGDGMIYPFHPPNRGDVIIFRAPVDPDRDFVKRVIGVPGDVVEIVDGDVFVNGERLDEPYLDKDRKDNFTMRPRKVPEDAYFVLGDNRWASDDSRKWGFVPRENIIGKAWVAYWPFNQWSVLLSFSWLRP